MRLFTSGFELNDTTVGHEWSSVSGTSIVTSPVHGGGTYAARCNPAASTAFYRQHVYATDQSTAGYLRFYLRIASAPTVAFVIARFATVAAASCGQMRLNTNRTLRLDDAAGTQIGSASAALALDTWYRIELKIDASSNPGSVEARVDGTAFASGANSAQSPFARISVGCVSVSTTTDIYLDDVAINDSAGSAQTSWPGESLGVKVLRPSGDGGSHEWANTANAAGSDLNYQLVDDIAPDDATTMIQSNATDAVDWYTLDNAGLTNQSIPVVQVRARLRNNTADATTAAKLQARVEGAGTIVQSAALIPNSTTWQTTAEGLSLTPLTLYVDPDATAWNPTSIDNLQIGVKLTTTGTNRIQVSALWATIDYAVGANQTVAVTPATESDTSKNVNSKQRVAVGAATETDSSKNVNSIQSVVVGIAAETDEAADITPLVPTIGVTYEIDLAAAVAPVKVIYKAVTAATETESASAVALKAPLRAVVAAVAETDAASAVSVLTTHRVLVLAAYEVDGVYPVELFWEMAMPVTPRLQQSEETGGTRAVAPDHWGPTWTELSTYGRAGV